MKGKNILITGVSGFVGSYLAKYLLDRGANVWGLVRRRADGIAPKNLSYHGIINEVNLVEGDVRDISSLASALHKAQPDVVFHLAAQSFVQGSFLNPVETLETNVMGTTNLLEAIRTKSLDPKIIFAGSSEEYGLVITSHEQLEKLKERYGNIFPEPKGIPELPVNEENPLRPMSPYAVSKVYGDYLMRNYRHAYGLRTVVSRGFNHEGAGRGAMFVTSTIASQVMKLKFGEADSITIGNVNTFRDWSHISDVVKGYVSLAERGEEGEIYNQGSQRTNSVLSYILMSLEEAGFLIKKIVTVKGDKIVENPSARDHSPMFGSQFEKTAVDRLLLEGKLEYSLSDEGINVHTDKGTILINFDPQRFRLADVPILMSDTSKFQSIGFSIEHKLEDIIRDQLNYFLDKTRRANTTS